MLPAVIKRIFPFLINLLLEELTTKFRALHNEHVSIEAKEHAEQMLQKLNEEEARHELLEGGEHPPYHRHQRRSSIEKRTSSPQERINAARGYKAYVLFSNNH